MIILPQTQLDKANVLVEKIRAQIAQLSAGEFSMRLTILADQALYKSKTSG